MRNTIHTANTRLALLLALALLTACASSPPQPDVDYKHDFNFSGIRTVAFLPQSGGSSGDSTKIFLSDMQINRIDTALSRTLEVKGLQVINDPKKADALISWHLVAQEKTDIRTYNTGPTYGGMYGGYRGYNRAAFYNCWNCGTDVRVKQYTQGTFIVDIIDPTLNQSVWRSIVQSRMKGELSKDQATYDTAAGRIMAAFPPN
ncbi:MAG: DUF4136 domain-containing protein [Halieaceae bacterium]